MPEGFNLTYPIHFPKENFMKFKTIEGKKEINLHTYLYDVPEGIQPRGIIYLLHGLGAYVGETFDVAEALAKSGYICTGFDMKGYGQSEGTRAYFTSFDHWVADLENYIVQTTAIFPQGLPKILLGLSAGGILAFYTAIKKPTLVDGIITYVPALTKPADLKPTLTKIVNKFEKPLRLIGKIPLTSMDPNTFSKDENIKYKMKNDPFIIHSKLRISNGIEILSIQRWMDSHIHELTLPAIVWAGENDEAVSSVGLEKLLQKVNPELVSYHLIPDVQHDFVFHKEPRDITLKGIFQWLEEKIHN